MVAPQVTTNGLHTLLRATEMKHETNCFLCVAFLLSATSALTGCGGAENPVVRDSAPINHPNVVRPQVAALQAVILSDDLTPDAISDLQDAIEALKSMVESLLDRTDISREELQALRTPIDELENSLSRVELRTRIPHGLHLGMDTRVYAQTEDDTLQAQFQDSTSQFAPLSATLRRSLGDPQSSARVDDFRIKSIAGDGADGFHIVYLVDDHEQTVHFRESDFDTPGCSGCYTREDENGITYWLLENDRGVLEFGYLFSGRFSLSDNDTNLRNYMTFGIRTSTSNLPTGAATYVGYMDSDTYEIDNPEQRGRIRGRLNLTTNFDAGTMEGRIRDLEQWSSSENSYLTLPASTQFAIRDGTLADGRLVADLVGVDTDASAPGAQTVRGYEGNVLGEFYGPGGEEFGGVASATSEEHETVLAGTLRGRRLNPRIPAGVPSVVSTAIDRDYPESATALSDTSRMTSIRSDDASGMYVTYSIDGTDHRIYMEGRDYGADSRYPTMYFESARNHEYFLWDYTGAAFVESPEFEFFNVSGWTVAEFGGADDDTPGFVARGPAVYGVATETLPAGTARYEGRVYASSEPMDHANHSLRSTMQGTISLAADFDAGTVGGVIDGIEVRVAGDSSFAATDGRIVVENGMFSGSQFRADLSGRHGQAGLEGQMDGRFFGPTASEVGGIFEGTNTSSGSVVYGWFGGTEE